MAANALRRKNQNQEETLDIETGFDSDIDLSDDEPLIRFVNGDDVDEIPDVNNQVYENVDQPAPNNIPADINLTDQGKGLG